MLVQKAAVHLFDGHVQPPEVAVVLGPAAGQRRVCRVSSSVFIRLVYDPELYPVCVRSRNAGHAEKLVGQCLEHPVLASLAETALLDARGEVQLVPLGIVFPAVVVTRLETMSPSEVELPHVLAHRVAPDPAAGTVLDVVVDFSVVDESAAPFVVAAGVVLEPGCSLDIRLLADKMIDGQTAHDICAVFDDGSRAGPDGAAPGGDAIVDEICEVRLRIITVRHHKTQLATVHYQDAVAHQPAMSLQRTWQLNRVNVVAGLFIGDESVIAHRDVRPVCAVPQILDIYIAAGLDNLILQSYARHAVRVGYLSADRHCLTRRRLLGRMRDLADMGWRVVQIYRLVKLGGRRISRTPATGKVIVEQRIDKLDGASGAGFIFGHGFTHRGPGKSELIVHLVDFVAVGIAESDRIAAIAELTFERAEYQGRRHVEPAATPFGVNVVRVLSDYDVTTGRQH